MQALKPPQPAFPGPGGWWAAPPSPVPRPGGQGWAKTPGASCAPVPVHVTSSSSAPHAPVALHTHTLSVAARWRPQALALESPALLSPPAWQHCTEITAPCKGEDTVFPN